MDNTTIFIIATLVSFIYLSAIAAVLGTRYRRQRERQELRQAELRFRETQLRYSASINTRMQRKAFELSLENLRLLNKITARQFDSDSEFLRSSIEEISNNTHAQLELFLNDFGSVEGDDDLQELSDLSLARTNEIRDLPSAPERGESK